MPETAVRRMTRRPKAPARDHSAIATQFEEDVLSGKFPACRLFKAAIERQRRDMAKPPDGFAFDAAAADKTCRLMEVLPFGGEGPKRGTPFRLEPWQVWLVRVLFGWRDPITGFARFRLSHVWLPKGNGKSPLAALIALAVLIQGGGGEKVYSAASTQKQARHVFDGAREMLNLAPKVGERFGLVVEEHAIKGLGDSRKYEPVSSEAGSIEGIRPSVVILDEVHVLPNRKLYDNLKSATNKVDGSRFVTISTAGFDMSPGAIGWQLYRRTRDILEGKGEDPTLFAFIVEADRKKPDGTDADPTDFEVWRQANPNLDVSVSVVGIKSAIQTWKDVPSERASLETKHLGWWQQTASAFLDVRRWRELGNPDLRLEDVKSDDGWRVYIGADLARTRDLTAAPVICARTRDDGKRAYRIFTRGRVWLPAESPTVNPEFRLWENQGWIVFVPGPSMGFAPLKAECFDVAASFPDVEVCIDDWGAIEVENDLAARGITVVSIRQGAKTQSEPMRELESAVLDGRIEHDGSPVTELCIGNLQAKPDAGGNVKPHREDEYKKIDVAVAIVNALVRAMLDESGPIYSETRGFASL